MHKNIWWADDSLGKSSEPIFIKVVSDFDSLAARGVTFCLIFTDPINHLESLWKEDDQSYVKSVRALLRLCVLKWRQSL